MDGMVVLMISLGKSITLCLRGALDILVERGSDIPVQWDTDIPVEWANEILMGLGTDIHVW